MTRSSTSYQQAVFFSNTSAALVKESTRVSAPEVVDCACPHQSGRFVAFSRALRKAMLLQARRPLSGQCRNSTTERCASSPHGMKVDIYVLYVRGEENGIWGAAKQFRRLWRYPSTLAAQHLQAEDRPEQRQRGYSCVSGVQQCRY